MEGVEGSGVTRGLKASAAFENNGAASIDYDFGGDRGIDQDRFLSLRFAGLQASDIFVSMPLPLQERAGTGKRIFSTRNKQLSYKVTASSGLIEIQFCLDPKRPRAVDAGSYQGALLIESTNVKPLSVPISADLRESRDTLVWGIALVSLILGLAIKTLVDLAKADAPISGKAFRDYLTWNFLLQIVAGFALTLVIVWQTYYSSATFGGQESDWTTLVGAIAAAVTSGISIASFSDIGKSKPLIGPGPSGGG